VSPYNKCYHAGTVFCIGNLKIFFTCKPVRPVNVENNLTIFSSFFHYKFIGRAILSSLFYVLQKKREVEGVEGIQVLCENSLINNLLATIVTTTNRAYIDLEVRTKFLYKQSCVSNSHITIHGRIIFIHQLCHSA
jgi:hypothetical protein